MSFEGERRVARMGLGATVVALILLLWALPHPWEVPTGPSFFPPEGRRAFGHAIRIGAWWGALVNLVLAAVLLVSVPWWLRPVSEGPRVERMRPGARWWISVVALVALAGVARWPLAGGSLWWDEGWSVRRIVVGSFMSEGVPREENRFKATDLRHPLWSYRKPTNHVAYNVSAFGADRTWRRVTKPQPGVFSERVFRLPAFTAGLVGIAAVAALGAAWGAPAAGLGAAAWLVLHPWHHRYGVDGRAYSFVLALMPLVALALTAFLRRPSNRSLLAYAASVALLLWSFPYSILLVATFAATSLLWLFRTRASAAEAWAWSLRFAAAHLLVGMLLLQLLAPNMTQIGEWHYTTPLLRWGGLRELWAGLALGLPFADLGSELGFPSLSDSWGRFLLAVAVLPPVVALGAWRVTRHAAAAPVVLAWLAAAPVSFGVNALVEQQFFVRYGIFLLPLVALLVAFAFETSRGSWRSPGRIGLALLLVALAVAVAPQRRMLLERPYAPLRDVAERLAEERRQAGGRTLAVGFGLGGGMPHIYDPELLHAEDATDLRKFCTQAAAEGLPLFAFYGHPRHNGKRRPEGVALLDDSTRFAPIVELGGIDPEFQYRVLRWTGASCEPLR